MNKTFYIIVAAILVLVCLACIVIFSDFSGLQTPEPTHRICIQPAKHRIESYEDYLLYVNDNCSTLPDNFIHAGALQIIGGFYAFEYYDSHTYFYGLSTETGNLWFHIVHDGGSEEDTDKVITFLDRDLLGEDMCSLTQKKSGHIKRNGLYYWYNSDGKLRSIAWIVNGTYMEWQAGSLEGTVLSGLLSLDDEEFQESAAVLTEAFGFVPSETPTPTTP